MIMTHAHAQRLADEAFPAVDARTQTGITSEQAQFFRDNGLLVIRNLVGDDELAALRQETQILVRLAESGATLPGFSHPDFFFKDHELTGERTPFRIEYVIDKLDACRALLGHPFVLNSVQTLQGTNFVPTWDAMVFKRAGLGAAFPWHRDAAATQAREETAPIFNVDFYLDEADLTNCVWGILGSNRWSAERTQATIAALTDGGEFRTDDSCVPIVMRPGDVLLHNILVLHGSPAARSGLRRVIYYEFRPAEIESAIGPHTPEYLPLKQNVLHRCLAERAKTPYAAHETPFVYRPTPPFDTFVGDDLSSLRYPHAAFWRA
jgi:ectoine hydroxylase-related dioxygenase (phytanoyl-CoA dioxygenase family)